MNSIKVSKVRRTKEAAAVILFLARLAAVGKYVYARGHRYNSITLQPGNVPTDAKVSMLNDAGASTTYMEVSW